MEHPAPLQGDFARGCDRARAAMNNVLQDTAVFGGEHPSKSPLCLTETPRAGKLENCRNSSPFPAQRCPQGFQWASKAWKWG